MRVFLRCPDQAVELTKILATPPGIKAVISSPSELTVTLEPGAPGVIDGVVEVATTAEGRPPLRVPVVRYAPAVASASAPKLHPAPRLHPRLRELSPDRNIFRRLI